MKKVLFFLVLFLIPFFTYAETRLTASTQEPLVGDTVIIRLDLNYDTTKKIKEAHYIINYDPMYLSLDAVFFPQTEATYTNNNGQIQIDKYAENPEDYWLGATEVQLNMRVLKAGVIPIKISENGIAKYENDAFISQVYHGITLNASEPSGDTTIYSLKVAGYNIIPSFSQSIHEYTLTVAPEVDEVEIKVSKADDKQEVTGIGTRKLEYGPNKVNVNIIAQNGNTQNYVIMITRTDNRTGDTSLKQVKVGDVIATYNSEEGVYYATVPKQVDKAIIIAQPTDSYATVIGNGEKQFEIGKNNIFEVTVETAKNTTKSYKIVVERESVEREVIESSTNLKSLTINNVSIDLSNDKTKIAYGANKDDKTLSITAIAESNTAKVDVANVELEPGANTISIKVTEKDGKTKEYTIIAYKPLPNYTKVESLDTITSDKAISYNVSENSTHIIDNVKNLKNKELLYNVVNLYNAPIYILKFSNFNYNSSIDASFTKTTNNTLTYKTILPENIDITLYVGEYFDNNTYLKIYTYNEGENQTMLTEAVKVVNGYINFTTNGKIYYTFSVTALTNNTKFEIKNWILPIVVGVIIIILLIIGLANKKKKIKNTPSY